VIRHDCLNELVNYLQKKNCGDDDFVSHMIWPDCFHEPSKVISGRYERAPTSIHKLPTPNAIQYIFSFDNKATTCTCTCPAYKRIELLKPSRLVLSRHNQLYFLLLNPQTQFSGSASRTQPRKYGFVNYILPLCCPELLTQQVR
jgi:hypothetical protein